MCLEIEIAGRRIGEQHSPYLIAEISGNHGQDINIAKEIIEESAKAGADAVKLQTYTPDTLTLPSKKHYFRKEGSLWDGRYLYDLYQEGMTPWEWFPELNAHAKAHNVTLFSTPFDETAVDFLEESIDPPAYKIASYELNHVPLLKKVGSLKKPVIISTGMATEEEIKLALETLKHVGCENIVVLKCITSYPANPKDFNLKSIQTLKEKFGCLAGLSDHCLSNEVCLGAVALGACVIEKHVTLRREDGAIDAGFSLEPEEFAEMARGVRLLHEALGKDTIGPAEQEVLERDQRRSIFVAKDMGTGDIITKENVRVVRPGHGLEPKMWEEVLGKRTSKSLEAGEPLKVGDWI